VLKRYKVIMAIIAPFRGLTYNFKVIRNPAKVMSPPYDVISEEEQTAFYQADPHNVIRLILGKKYQGDSDWDNRYTRASDFFQRWQSQGVLLRDDRPSMYLTSLTYHPVNGGSPRVRWGFIALARIEDEDSDVILPHEKTFSAHKDDRLMLMRTCHAQFSQIFCLYEDPEDHVLGYMKKNMPQKPQVSFEVRDGTFQCGTVKYNRCYLTGPGNRVYVLEPYGSGWFILPDGRGEKGCP